MQGDGAQQSPGHGACHHTHAETSAHEPEVASPIFPIGDVGDIGASNRTCGAGDAGHDASGVEDPSHTKAAKRADGTSTPAVRKMRIDSKTSWLSACRRAGIEDFRFHDLRHTWASWLIQSGVPLSVLQEMGGWESIEMVRRYAHLAPNHLTEHARKIDDIFGDNVPNMSHSGIMEDIKKA